MYFSNHGLRWTWLDKYLKSLVLVDPSKSHIANGPNTDEIFTIAPLSYLLISKNGIELGKVSHSHMKNVRTVC